MVLRELTTGAEILGPSGEVCRVLAVDKRGFAVLMVGHERMHARVVYATRDDLRWYMPADSIEGVMG